MIPKLYAVVDLHQLEIDELYISSLLEAGVRLLQLQSKTITPAELTRFSRSVLNMRNELAPDCRIIINDSIEVAAESGADGVHLGQTDRPVSEARKLLGPAAFIGLSTHNAGQVRKAPVELLSYLAFGPVFLSQTKTGHAPVTGLAALETAAAQTPLPVVAIGGITAENAARVFAAGAASVAVISDLRRAEDLRQRLKLFAGA